jgi:hypothetical protein
MAVIDKNLMLALVVGNATPEDPRFGEAEAILVYPNESAGAIMDRCVQSLRKCLAPDYDGDPITPIDDYRLAVMSGSYENLLYVTSCMVETVFMP